MINPYKDVKWDGCQRVVSSSHYHCQSRQQVIKAYEQQGLRHFAFSNYHMSEPYEFEGGERASYVYWKNPDDGTDIRRIYDIKPFFPAMNDKGTDNSVDDAFNSIASTTLLSPNAEHAFMTNDGCGSLHINGLGSTWFSGCFDFTTNEEFQNESGQIEIKERKQRIFRFKDADGKTRFNVYDMNSDGTATLHTALYKDDNGKVVVETLDTPQVIEDDNITSSTAIGVNNTWQYAVDNILANLRYPSGGGVTINHPNYPFKKAYQDLNGTGYKDTIPLEVIKSMLDYDNRVLGLEIYNGNLDKTELDEYPTSLALDKWDEVLKTGRRAWGFCVQDWDNNSKNIVALRQGRSILLVDEFTEQKCLEAYRNGNFYGQLGKITTDENGNECITCDLRFENISYSYHKLSVSTNNATTLKIIVDGNETVIENRYVTDFVIPNNATYVRVEAHTADDSIFSNPIILKPYSDKPAKKKQNVLMWF